MIKNEDKNAKSKVFSKIFVQSFKIITAYIFVNFPGYSPFSAFLRGECMMKPILSAKLDHKPTHSKNPIKIGPVVSGRLFLKIQTDRVGT